MSEIAQSERASLCDLFLDVGPDAPTLAGSWTSSDLAAHLIVRERRPLAGVGIVFAPMAGFTERSMSSEQDKRSYDEMVGRVRTGPPPPMKWVDEAVNTIEFFVHHEDVRRGAGDPTPRARIDAVDDALWGRLGRMGGMLARGVKGVGLTLVRTDSDERMTVRKGDPEAELRGTPGELVMYLYGRGEHAEVELTGYADAVEVVRGAPFGL